MKKKKSKEIEEKGREQKCVQVDERWVFDTQKQDYY